RVLLIPLRCCWHSEKMQRPSPIPIRPSPSLSRMIADSLHPSLRSFCLRPVGLYCFLLPFQDKAALRVARERLSFGTLAATLRLTARGESAQAALNPLRPGVIGV